MRRVLLGWSITPAHAAPSLIGLALCAGCVSLSSAQQADTIGEGRLQLGVEPGVSFGVDTRPLAVTPSPAPDLSLRYGAFERLDLGGRLGASGAELQAKLMFTPRWSPFIASLAPSIAGQPRLSSTLAVTGLVVNFALPLLLGVRLGPHQLVLGPRLHLFGATGAAPGRLFAAGGSFGAVFRVSRAVAVMPEVGVVVPLGAPADPNALDSYARLGRGALAQLRLAFLVGEPGP